MAETPMRTVRVSDELWDAVRVKAQAADVTVSAVIVAALREYVNDR